LKTRKITQRYRLVASEGSVTSGAVSVIV